MCCSVIFTRREPRRDLQHAGCLDSDSTAAFGTSRIVLITVRLNGGCFLRISVAAAIKIRELYSTITSELSLIAKNAMLSWNCSLLSSSDDRGLLQVGIVDGSVIECALAMRGGMQPEGAAKTAAVRSRANGQVRKCISKVQSLKSLVDRTIFSIPQRIASDAAVMESGRLTESVALHGTGTKVIVGGTVTGCIYLVRVGWGTVSMS